MKRYLSLFCLNVLALNLGGCDGEMGGTDSGRADSGGVGRDSGPGGIDSGPGGGIDGGDDAGWPGCPVYPYGAVEPMALGSVIWPYRWPTAIASDGTDFPLDLSNVPCTADENIDWSPFDVLVFIAFPAW
ncbi:MAG: hypothetical protein AB7S26_01795 [Sandaracinaceae bacterium]